MVLTDYIRFDNNCLRKYGDEMYLLRVSIILCLHNKRNPNSGMWTEMSMVKDTDCIHPTTIYDHDHNGTLSTFAKKNRFIENIYK